MKASCYDLNDVDRNVEKICCHEDKIIVEAPKRTCDSLAEHEYR